MNGLWAAIATLLLSSIPAPSPYVMVEAQQIERAVEQHMLKTEQLVVSAECDFTELLFEKDDVKTVDCSLQPRQTETEFTTRVTLSEKNHTVHIDAVIIANMEETREPQ